MATATTVKKKTKKEGLAVEKTPAKKQPKKQTTPAGKSEKSSGKSLVIVESPSKAKTIVKYLGRGFTVMASIGHVKDLPKSKLGIDIENGFRPDYTVIKGKAKVLAEIKKAAACADAVYLAPDPDREGEAIAWHLAEEIQPHNNSLFRVLFNEITEKGVRQAMQSPGQINMNKVNAQQARRVLDRVVGYKISPLLWQKVRYGLSAGRVQSVAVQLICNREEEILAFVPREYWSIDAELRAGMPPPFHARLIRKNGKTIPIPTGEAAEAIVTALRAADYRVSKIEKKERRLHPSPPFITSHLQQDAIRKLHYTAKKAMMVAQQLYEGIETRADGTVGLITYMRTDSFRISNDFQGEALNWITQQYGAAYRPDSPNFYRSKKGAQEAHEAIRPTSMARHPESVRQDLTPDQYRLYKLIWDRFVASQMTPALYDMTQVDVMAGEFLLRATGKVIKFPGFMTVYTEEMDPDTQPKKDVEEGDAGEGTLPPLSIEEQLVLIAIKPKQHFTQPPPRYNEALLIHDLEEKGIGRPSTYATIISTIQEREYVEKREARFHPTEIGKTVNGLLVENFPKIVNVEFTAHMEEELDGIEEGRKEWTETLREFYEPFNQDLEKAQGEMRDVKREEVSTDLLCEKCGAGMVIKNGRFGRFLACSGYPECKNTKEFVEKGGTIEIVALETKTDERCEKCGAGMVIKNGRFGKFLACSAYPTCKSTRPIGIGVLCPEVGCGGAITEKRSKRGRVFYSCAKYPTCKFALWDRPVPEPCPLCQAPFMVEKGRKIVCRIDGCGYRKGDE